MEEEQCTSSDARYEVPVRRPTAHLYSVPVRSCLGLQCLQELLLHFYMPIGIMQNRLDCDYVPRGERLILSLIVGLLGLLNVGF